MAVQSNFEPNLSLFAGNSGTGMLPVFGRGISFDSGIVSFVCSISISVAFFFVKYINTLDSANSHWLE